MTKLLVILSFIPWILYFLSYSINLIKELRSVKLDKNFIKDNILKLLKFDKTILIIIFILFSLIYRKADQIKLIRILLFAAINLYLFLHCIYDKKRITEPLKKKENKIVIIISILMLIPIIFYFLHKKYTITYYLMFAFSFFNPIIVLLLTTLYKKVKRKNEKHL